MIKFIVGLKGTGKTASMVSQINGLAEDAENNIVCIEGGKRFDGQLPYTVRLVDIEEYPVKGYEQLLSFIAGVIAKDYDISHIFIDSIYKVAQVDGAEGLVDFTKELEKLSDQFKVEICMSVSDDPANLPAELDSYVDLHE
jgi:hypothetical protein